MWPSTSTVPASALTTSEPPAKSSSAYGDTHVTSRTISLPSPPAGATALAAGASAAAAGPLGLGAPHRKHAGLDAKTFAPHRSHV